MGESTSIRSGVGPICVQPLVVAGVLTTTAIKPTLQAPATVGQNRTLKVKIVNGSATGTIAWQLVPRGAAIGTVVATYGANAGSHITPGATEILAFDMMFELVLVADSASNNYSVTSVPF